MITIEKFGALTRDFLNNKYSNIKKSLVHWNAINISIPTHSRIFIIQSVVIEKIVCKRSEFFYCDHVELALLVGRSSYVS